MDSTPSFDAIPPAGMAEKAVQLGIKKANSPVSTLSVLGFLAGAYIAMGAIFATAVTSGANGLLSYGVTKLLSGLTFCLGLILVVVGGAELFTGNMLIIMAWADGKVTLKALLRNWLIVYLANFAGSIVMAGLIFYSGQYAFGHGVIGINMLTIGETKTSLAFFPAVYLGILCNMAVCLAVWLTYSARTTTDKIMAIIFPITMFVAAGFEHSVANMYFIPSALFIKYGANQAFFDAIEKTPADFPHLTWENFLIGNLLPVTIGNIIGGVVMVGLIYWYAYLRKKPS
ncbi:formate/nitrite transporter family protein [Leptolinea tardivitalis]|uniref:Formate transporter n=1 Tax=Leptolinea tardivitalis TaxID=229920 RepID=A0A0P6WXM4_9CHLR|nr:formate transporter FocA [Leptolinea tardivitalis]KPL71053.1 formate transporter [Leptolinea tardivitalis]GAP22465.1 formate/nitrite transporter [Leptolinea tardivitalis]